MWHKLNVIQKLIVPFFAWVYLVDGLYAQKILVNQHKKATKFILNKQQRQLIFESLSPFPSHTEYALAFIKNGVVTFVGLKKGNDSILFTNNNKNAFVIGSITKLFTATLLASLVVDKHIKVNQAINKYLDYNLNFKDTITLQSLANHTSGLPRLPSNLILTDAYQNNPYKTYDSDKLSSYLKNKVKLNHIPSTTYEYSNLGAGLLGTILSKIENRTLEYLLQERILKPYEMVNSSTDKTKITTKIVRGLTPNGKIASFWNFDVLAGAGALLSTTEDLSKFALAQFNNNNLELQLTQQPTFTIKKGLQIGLGWHISNTKNNESLLWHNGGTGGYKSIIALHKAAKNGVIILTNVSAFHTNSKNVDTLCFNLLHTLSDE